MAERRLQRTRDAYAEEGITDTHWYQAKPVTDDMTLSELLLNGIQRKWVTGDMTPSDLADLLAGD